MASKEILLDTADEERTMSKKTSKTKGKIELQTVTGMVLFVKYHVRLYTLKVVNGCRKLMPPILLYQIYLASLDCRQISTLLSRRV